MNHRNSALISRQTSSRTSGLGTSPLIRRWLRAFGAGLLLAGALIGCGADPGALPGEDVAESSESLYYKVSKIWPQRDVFVCWDFPGYATEKEWVRQALSGQRSWSANGNVAFVGWVSTCNTFTTGIKIGFTDAQAMTLYLGEPDNDIALMYLDFGPNVEMRYPDCSMNGLSRESCIKSTALHEFGHAIGYAHEHLRPEKPASCTLPQTGNHGDATFGPYDPNSIMNYCAFANDLSGLDRRGTDRIYGQYYGDTRNHRDLNLDGKADLICADARTGTLWWDFADWSGTFGNTDGSKAGNWCNDAQKRLLKGDFNGDGRVDLLCHGVKFGTKAIDYADLNGHFGGPDWTNNTSYWCNHATARLLVGDFNADNRDDIVCHDAANGYNWIDYADINGRFGGTDSVFSDYCYDPDRFFIGDFNGDGRDDMFCQSQNWLAVIMANGSGVFPGAFRYYDASFCAAPGNEIHLGDVNNDDRVDVVCHDTVSGSKAILYSGPDGRIGDSGSWSSDPWWCMHNAGQFSLGDFNGDGRDDFMCHDVSNGNKWIAWANSYGQFFDTADWFTSGGWCSHAAGELH